MHAKAHGYDANTIFLMKRYLKDIYRLSLSFRFCHAVVVTSADAPSVRIVGCTATDTQQEAQSLLPGISGCFQRDIRQNTLRSTMKV